MPSLIPSNSEQMALRAMDRETLSTSLFIPTLGTAHPQQGAPHPHMQLQGEEADLCCPPLVGVPSALSQACLISLFVIFWKGLVNLKPSSVP